MITKKQIEKARGGGLYDIQERVDGAGFVYFPGGRVTWTVKGEGDDTEVELFESWGSPTKPQVQDILRLVFLYVGFNRQQKEAACPGTV